MGVFTILEHDGRMMGHTVEIEFHGLFTEPNEIRDLCEALHIASSKSSPCLGWVVYGCAAVISPRKHVRSQEATRV